MPSPVGHISDTALWVAVYRAIETERPDAVFRDPYARALAGERGERILSELGSGARSDSWAFVVRTAVLDELILRAVSEGADTVVNLAAGLDARPWRLPLPPSLTWIEVDLPAILAYKKEKLAGAPAVCAVESVALDLSDLPARRALFERVGAAGRRVLAITEGLLIYLSPEQVGALAADLARGPTFRWWATDLVSPRLLAFLQKRYGRALEAGGAPLLFGPPEGVEFFRPFGWRAVEARDSFREGRRLRREPPFAPVLRFLIKLIPPGKRAAGTVALLERL
jgi:methyltransferase (TIGR00027 family)